MLFRLHLVPVLCTFSATLCTRVVCCFSYAFYTCRVLFQIHILPADLQPADGILADELCHRAGSDDAGWGLCLLLLGLQQEQGHPRLPHPGSLLQEFQVINTLTLVLQRALKTCKRNNKDLDRLR